jgi:hypothetical protein
MFRIQFVELPSNIMQHSIIIIYHFTYFKDFNEYGSVVTTKSHRMLQINCLFERFKSGLLSNDGVTKKRISSVVYILYYKNVSLRKHALPKVLTNRQYFFNVRTERTVIACTLELQFYLLF